MPGEGKSRDELLSRFEAAISGLELADLRMVARDLSMFDSRVAAHEPRATLRRPPRDQPAIFRLRADLDHAHPPIWRRLELRSHLTLDVVHQVLQAAFGWTDSHLHRFALGGGPFDRHSELFLCPFDVEEGEDEGLPASSVRLDETVQEPGDVLRYVYDYGDNWELILRLEEVLPADDAAPVATCMDGERAAPPEDCGGITDADDLAEVLDDPAHLDLDEVNQALRAPYVVLGEYGVHPRLVGVANRLRFTAVGEDLAARLVSLTLPTQALTTEEMAAALRAHLWFLDRAGAGGIELTSAGYLKPADVEAACALVPAMGEWIGKNNREINALPLLDFRQSLQSVGLLRKYKGRLMLTRAGAAARGKPDKLWRHLAERLVPTTAGTYVEEASLLLLAYAATSPGDALPLGQVAEALGDLGWRRADRKPLEYYDVHRLGVYDMISNVSAEPVSFRDRDRVSVAAAALARDALVRSG